MEEVEAICHRVAIIDHGRLLRQGTLDELLDRTEFDVSGPCRSPPCGADWKTPRQCRSPVAIRTERQASWSARASKSSGRGGPTVCVPFSSFWKARRIPLLEIKSQEANLETLFLRLTGRKLRD